MKKTLILLSLALSLVSQAQSIEHGLVGFATTSNYGVGGTYGGSLGSLVYAKNESELRQYCSASQAYVILFEGTISTTNEKDIQVASNKSIIGFFHEGVYMEMLNPRMISKLMPYEAEEGCLSLTGTRKTTRYNLITVRYQTRSFEEKQGVFTGFTAQIIQHELDHLNGIII